MQPIPAHVAEHVVREFYGRLLAFLAAQVSDVTLAEDALADALNQGLAQCRRAACPSMPKPGSDGGATADRDHTRHAQVVEGATERLLSRSKNYRRPEARGGQFLDSG